MHLVIFLTAELAVEGCLYIIYPLLDANRYVSNITKLSSVGAAKWHSAVRTHIFCTVSFLLDVNMAHSTIKFKLLGFTVYT